MNNTDRPNDECDGTNGSGRALPYGLVDQAAIRVIVTVARTRPGPQNRRPRPDAPRDHA